MRKLLLSLAVCIPAIASANFNLLTVNLTDNQKVEIVLEDEMKLKFTPTHLIAEGGKTDVSVEKGKIINFTHSYDPSVGIDRIADDSGYEYRGGELRFYGLPAASQLTVCNAAGIVMASETVEGDYTLPLDRFAAGVYIVKVNNKSFKISVK